MTNMDPNQFKHTQLPTAHVRSAEVPSRVEPHDIAAISANLIKLAKKETITSMDRLVEGWQLATHDKLIPQMLNRDGIEEHFARYRPKHAGVMLLDMRRFKKFNELYGQKKGDEVLQNVGQKLLSRLRTHQPADQPVHPDRRNTSATDVVGHNVPHDVAAGRYGGDEFIAVVNLDEIDADKRVEVMEAISGRLADFGTFKVSDGIEEQIEMHSVYEISDNAAITIPDIYGRLSLELPKAKQTNRGQLIQ